MQRRNQIETWLSGLWPGESFQLAPASADASFRRYFRVSRGAAPTLIVMDAPPSHEDCRPWLKIQRVLHEAGAHVPEVIAQDLDQGFLVISDLGNATYLSILDADNASFLYSDATATLIDIQKASKPGVLPEYDVALLQRELDLFPDWFVARHHGSPLPDADRATLQKVFERILAVNLAEPRVYVHRDYQAGILIVIADEPGRNPGVIDFQDAVCGPISYDLVSVCKVAYVNWGEEVVVDCVGR